MNIVYIAGYFFPEQTADTNLNMDVVTSLATEGHSVKVIVPFPSRGIDKKTQTDYLLKRKENINANLQIIRVGSLKKYKNSFFKKALFLVKNTNSLYKEVKKHDADLYFIVSTPPFLGKIAIKLHKKNKKIIYKLQDVFPDSLKHTKGYKEKHPLIKFFRRYEQKVYSSVSRIIAVSDDVKNTLINRGVSNSKIDVVFDWVDSDRCVPVLKEKNYLFDDLNISRNDFVVYYAGNLGYLQDLDVMIEAANELRDSGIKFVIIGNGTREEEIKNKIANYKLSSIVRMFPMMPSEKVSYVYSIGDIGLVLLNSNITKYAFPSKTWSVMSAGKMVVCESESDTQLARMIEGNNLGKAFEPHDHKMLSKIIYENYRNKVLCAEMGKNGREFVVNKLNKQKAIDGIIHSIDFASKEI